MLGFSLGKSSSVAYVRVQFISYALLGLRSDDIFMLGFSSIHTGC